MIIELLIVQYCERAAVYRPVYIQHSPNDVRTVDGTVDKAAAYIHTHTRTPDGRTDVHHVCNSYYIGGNAAWLGAILPLLNPPPPSRRRSFVRSFPL